MANYITVEDAKRQCIIDTYFTDDDLYLQSLCDTAETIVSELVNEDLDVIAACHDGELPTPLIHAMKMLVEYMYANRGTDNENQIPDAVYMFIKLYRNFA